MGYEFGFERIGHSSLKSDSEDSFWSMCGWRCSGLHDALVIACAQGAKDLYDDVVIDVSSLGFLERVQASCSAQRLVDILVALSDIDYDYAFELWESFPEVVRGAVRLSFVADDLTPEQKDVCRELVTLFEDGCFNVLEGLVAGIARMREADAKSVVLYCSF